MENPQAVESLLALALNSCYRFAGANQLLLPTADVLVAFLWLRMRPFYRLVSVSLGADAAGMSEEFNRWWASGGAPQVLVREPRKHN